MVSIDNNVSMLLDVVQHFPVFHFYRQDNMYCEPNRPKLFPFNDIHFQK